MDAIFSPLIIAYNICFFLNMRVNKETHAVNTYTKYVKIKTRSIRKRRNLLHISGINRHPQGDVLRKM